MGGRGSGRRAAGDVARAGWAGGLGAGAGRVSVGSGNRLINDGQGQGGRVLGGRGGCASKAGRARAATARAAAQRRRVDGQQMTAAAGAATDSGVGRVGRNGVNGDKAAGRWRLKTGNGGLRAGWAMAAGGRNRLCWTGRRNVCRALASAATEIAGGRRRLARALQQLGAKRREQLLLRVRQIAASGGRVRRAGAGGRGVAASERAYGEAGGRSKAGQRGRKGRCGRASIRATADGLG